MPSGARRASAVDAAATLVVRERGEDGALGPALRTLPRPRKTDDKRASLAARARLKTLATDVAAVAKRQIFRLERAMVSGRTRDRATFEARVVGHPLLGAIARATPAWSERERQAAAAVLDLLWNPPSYERLVSAWGFDAAQAIGTLTWLIGLVEDAIRTGRRPQPAA